MFYQHTNYKELLKESIEFKKNIEKSFNRQVFARKIGIQKSYLSKVLNGMADFSFDQMYSTAKVFNWNEEKLEFANLLLDHSRSGNAERKKVLMRKVKKLQSLQSKLSKHLKDDMNSPSNLKDYFLNPELQLIYVGLSLKKYKNNLNLLANNLAIPENRFFNHLNKLHELELINIDKNKKVILLKENIHLPKESDYFQIWHVLLKQYMHAKITNKINEGYNFSTLFSTDQETYTWLKGELAQLLKKCQKKVNNSNEDEIYYFNIDLNCISNDS